MDTARVPGLFELSGRVALVTGAGRGLGRTLALALAAAGADVAVNGRGNSSLEDVAAAIRAVGRRSTAHVADVSDLDRQPSLVRDVLAAHGRIDILVNNAGVKIVQDAVDVTEQAWDAVVGTNLKAAFFLAQAVGRHMLERGAGKIVNVASTYAVVGAPGRVTYAASKGGLLQITRTLSAEWAGRGVNVNAVGPTSIETPMNAALFDDKTWRAAALAKIPAGRFCRPEDVVGPVVFLCSPASDMVHGQLLLVDGGLTAV